MADYGPAERRRAIAVLNGQGSLSLSLDWCYGRNAGQWVCDCKSAIRRFDSDRRLSIDSRPSPPPMRSAVRFGRKLSEKRFLASPSGYVRLVRVLLKRALTPFVGGLPTRGPRIANARRSARPPHRRPVENVSPAARAPRQVPWCPNDHAEGVAWLRAAIVRRHPG